MLPCCHPCLAAFYYYWYPSPFTQKPVCFSEESLLRHSRTSLATQLPSYFSSPFCPLLTPSTPSPPLTLLPLCTSSPFDNPSSHHPISLSLFISPPSLSSSLSPSLCHSHPYYLHPLFSPSPSPSPSPYSSSDPSSSPQHSPYPIYLSSLLLRLAVGLPQEPQVDLAAQLELGH